VVFIINKVTGRGVPEFRDDLDDADSEAESAKSVQE
jgi:hypothetical protein